jgi:glycosyltransferase involved in cell wall biosynthesis
MRIAQVAPLYEAVPPRLYGGTERVVAYLCDALARLGHQVTLFASAEARTLAQLSPVRQQAIRLDARPLKSDVAAHLLQIDAVRRRATEFDVVHFHTDMLHFPMFESVSRRTVTTLHGRLDLVDLPEVYHRWSDFPLVSISAAQRAPLPNANWEATVHHGVDPASFVPTGCGSGYLAFLGRISPEKRPDRAVAISRAAGLPLRVAAKVDRVDQAYFDEKIAALMLEPHVEFLGEIGDSDKSTFLGGAEALLFPIDWPEPFGLAMIEAMACGTPVIAYDHGSVREVIEEGRTGFIVRDETEAVGAVEAARRLDRGDIRRAFDERFTSESMARRYLDVYRRVIGEPVDAKSADPPRDTPDVEA